MSHTKIIPGTDVLDFFCDNGGEVSFGREYFARHSEHITLETMPDGHTWVSCGTRLHDVTPTDSLHPWERDLVTNGEPFARPSNRVRS